MKTVAVCTQCQTDRDPASNEPFLVDYFEDGIALIECPVGHKTALLLQNQKFEMLLDSGAIALLEGFTLEACISFSSALERFFEFTLRVVSIARGMPVELFDNMFSQMSRLSERQLGAFLITYAQEFKPPYRVKQKLIAFRNSVISKGMIPKLDEAHRFCSEIYNEIYHLFHELEQKYEDAIQTVIDADVDRRRAKLPADLTVSTAAKFHLLSLAETGNPSFAEAFNLYEGMLEKTKWI